MAFVTHFFRTPALSENKTSALLAKVNGSKKIKTAVKAIRTEFCFNVGSTSKLTDDENDIFRFLLKETFEEDQFSAASFLESSESPSAKKQKTGTASSVPAGHTIVEVGPRLDFSTAWSSNAVQICAQCRLGKVTRVERSFRYLLEAKTALSAEEAKAFADLVHDSMTEQVYPETLTSFASGAKPEEVYYVPVLEKGREALKEMDKKLGLGFDEQDLTYYTDLFKNKVGRDPSSVEVFDLAQSNSEHSRHWFFTGKMVFEGKELPETLFQLVKKPWKNFENNSVIGFCDNSSAQKGYPITSLFPKIPGEASSMGKEKRDYHITLTAETHNFPTGVAPFPGAETGTGGRLRDGHSTGTGSLVVAGTVAYCVGNLYIPGYDLPWEDKSFEYPSNLATPLQIIIDASNGASDYGNKFGEPLIQGFTRSYGSRLAGGERREWVKPIMFSGGVGQIDARHCKKGKPEKDMCIIKLGGPAYRIGMGGGAASSMVQGDNAAHLDFNAVQRGDAEMEQKTNRVIRACVELGDKNPIISIHDQGAGGNCNVLKEISEPAGAIINIRDVLSGDPTLSVLELWGAEFQENDALLIKPEHLQLFTGICARENAPFSVVGTITGDGKIVVHDRENDTNPVDLNLDLILGELPAKVFQLKGIENVVKPLDLPEGLTVESALDRVLRLLSVGSKRFLTSKVDRSVTGLIAQQQCVGPLQITLADVAVIAQSHFGVTGAAISIGEQPLKGLIAPAPMARMAVAESLTNLVWAKVSKLSDIKASGNWMWAAKLEGEGKVMYDAAKALSDMLMELEVAIDGGKDSLSMAARCPRAESKEQEMVKCPGELTMSCYVTCPDITLTVTPDFKLPGKSVLLFVSLSTAARLGGSALAQVYNQLGDESPDVESTPALIAAFNTVQELIGQRLISAGHDRSDGGLVTTVLEMAFAGNCGVSLTATTKADPMAYLFNEEIGLVMEVSTENEAKVLKTFEEAKVACEVIGCTREDNRVKISMNGESLLEADMRDLRDVWEATSFELDARQTNPECVKQEKAGLRKRAGHTYKLTYTPEPTPEIKNKPLVAVVRQEGSNGDREMCSAFHAAGFEAWDVHMSDIENGKVDLAKFRGIAFVGGFSYADVMDSAKGWAATIRFNPALKAAFDAFKARDDTFSLGVCNGCQLSALLGWVPFGDTPTAKQPRFIHNESERFESRWTTLKVEKSPAVMLQGMEGSTLGVWLAHGEGKAYFPEGDMLKEVLDSGLAPLRYVDEQNQPTTSYPFNPNGSPNGIASLCSKDGRHLALMPHPERCFLKWQWPYMPQDWKDDLKVSPWLKMFQNAREWCEKTAK